MSRSVDIASGTLLHHIQNLHHHYIQNHFHERVGILVLTKSAGIVT